MIGLRIRAISMISCCLPRHAYLSLVRIFVAIKDKTYPQSCFLNIDLPIDVRNHKGYKLTKQGKSFVQTGWRQVASDAEGGNVLSTMAMDTNSSASADVDDSTSSNDRLLFKLQVNGPHVAELDTDYYYIQEGYITVAPLGALTHPELDCHPYFKEWLPAAVAEHSSSSSTL